MSRINSDELEEEYTDGGSRLLVWNGEPFTGIAYEMSPQGSLRDEQSYEEGVLSGPSKDWYPSGQLRTQIDYRWNRVHGRNREWFENGQLKSDATVELGIVVRKQEWDEQGNFISDYRIENDAWNSNLLESERKLFKNAGVVYQKVE